MDSGRLVRLTRRQLGLFTRAQAQAYGISAYRIRSRIASGDWAPVHGSVPALAGVELTAKLRDRAVQLAIPGSVLAGPSAAGYWGIEIPTWQAAAAGDGPAGSRAAAAA